MTNDESGTTCGTNNNAYTTKSLREIEEKWKEHVAKLPTESDLFFKKKGFKFKRKKK